MSIREFIYTRRFWIVGISISLIFVLIIIGGSILQPKTKMEHLPLTMLPVNLPDTPPQKNLLFNSFTTPNNTQNITTQNNLLYATTPEGTINLQTNQVESAPPVTIDCQNNLQKIIKKISVKNPRCVDGYQNTSGIQDGTTAYIWQLTDDTTTPIILDEGEQIISTFQNTLLTKKNGVMGIRTSRAVNAVAFHENAQLYPITFDGKSRSFVLLEIVQNTEPKRGYFHLVKINESNSPSSQIIGSTHIIPESLDPLFKPVYVQQKKIIILRTMSNTYWLVSLTPSQLPYLSPSGVETQNMSTNMFSE